MSNVLSLQAIDVKFIQGDVEKFFTKSNQMIKDIFLICVGWSELFSTPTFVAFVKI